MTFGSTFGRTFSPTFQPKSQAAVSGGFAPTDITGLALWLDFSDADTLFTDAGSTKVSSDGQAIYQANDKSGAGNHAVQSSESYRPLYKVNIQNSLSATLFDNSNDYLAFPYPLGTATDFTVFLISRFTSVSNYDAITGRNQNDNTWWGAWAIHLSTGGKFYAGTDVKYRIEAPASPVVANNTFYSIRLKKSGTSAGNISLAVNNGTPAVNTKTAANPLSDEMSVGRRGESSGLTPYDGYLGEYIVYNAALSAEDITLVETYLNNKWAIY